MKSKVFIAMALGATFALPTIAAGAMDLSTMPDQSLIPAEAVQLSPVVPGMGEHWANPADLPLGPIYCVFEGKIICLEFMISQQDLEAGKSWPVLQGIDNLPPVNHLSIGFEPNGHDGFEIPHYDLHLYFLSPEEMSEVK